MSRRVVITGMGAVTPIGNNVEDFWANIKKVYYGCTKEDAGDIGFRDDIIYDYLKGKNKDLIHLTLIDRDECIKTFEKYKEENGTIY